MANCINAKPKGMKTKGKKKKKGTTKKSYTGRKSGY